MGGQLKEFADGLNLKLCLDPRTVGESSLTARMVWGNVVVGPGCNRSIKRLSDRCSGLLCRR